MLYTFFLIPFIEFVSKFEIPNDLRIKLYTDGILIRNSIPRINKIAIINEILGPYPIFISESINPNNPIIKTAMIPRILSTKTDIITCCVLAEFLFNKRGFIPSEISCPGRTRIKKPDLIFTIRSSPNVYSGKSFFHRMVFITVSNETQHISVSHMLTFILVTHDRMFLQSVDL